jgi:hypothetical protein
MNIPDVAPWLSALALATRYNAVAEEPGREPSPLVTVELRFERKSWLAVVKRGDQRLELAGLEELLRYLELLGAETPARPVHGLR